MPSRASARTSPARARCARRLATRRSRADGELRDAPTDSAPMRSRTRRGACRCRWGPDATSRGARPAGQRCRTSDACGPVLRARRSNFAVGTTPTPMQGVGPTPGTSTSCDAASWSPELNASGSAFGFQRASTDSASAGAKHFICSVAVKDELVAIGLLRNRRAARPQLVITLTADPRRRSA